MAEVRIVKQKPKRPSHSQYQQQLQNQQRINFEFQQRYIN